MSISSSASLLNTESRLTSLPNEDTNLSEKSSLSPIKHSSIISGANSNINSILNHSNSDEIINNINSNDNSNDNNDNEYSDTIHLSGKMPPRKRSKVSRACDECRRKKIRCNAVLNMSNNQVTKICTNCERTNEICSFTRIPLKRGPNKGYNKKDYKRKNDDNDSDNSINLPSQIQYSASNGGTHSNGNGNGSVTVGRNLDGTGSTALYPFGQSSTGQVILPPLNAIPNINEKQTSPQPSIIHPISRQRSISVNSQSSQNQSLPQNQFPPQQMFWKVPSDIPIISSHRRGSVDSNTSSISSLSNRQSIHNMINSPKMLGIETSDSEDEFFLTNSSRLSRSNFQIPFTTGRLPRVSFSKENNNSSTSSLNSIPKIGIGLPILTNNPTSFTGGNQKYLNFLKALQFNIDIYYGRYQSQFPLLPNKEVLLQCFENMEFDEYNSIFELFNSSLQILNSMEININFQDVLKCFESIFLMYFSKSFIYKNGYAKLIFTTTLVLLNYCVVLSGYDYSIGFAISFSYFKDWMIFKENFGNLNFRNLINLVILDNIYSLYFGTPRSSTLCFSIDLNFIENFFKNISFTENYNLEFLKIGIHLVILSNNMQELDTLNKLENFEITGTDFKFLNALKITNDIFVYCRKIPDNLLKYIATNSEDIDQFIFECQLEISKLIKKIINIIDEQLDDFEIYKIQPLLSIIILKCMKILKRLDVLANSIISLNELINKIEFNDRFKKILELIHNNLERCLNIQLPNQLIKKLLQETSNLKMNEINLIKTSTNNNINHLNVFQNWARSINAFLTTDLTKEGINGWSCI